MLHSKYKAYSYNVTNRLSGEIGGFVQANSGLSQLNYKKTKARATAIIG
jgi:hypothetical protein